MAKLQAFSRNGGNGSYIEFSDGTYVDGVGGDSYRPNGSAIPTFATVSELEQWANDNGVQWVDAPPASSATADEIEEYVG